MSAYCTFRIEGCEYDNQDDYKELYDIFKENSYELNVSEYEFFNFGYLEGFCNITVCSFEDVLEIQKFVDRVKKPLYIEGWCEERNWESEITFEPEGKHPNTNEHVAYDEYHISDYVRWLLDFYEVDEVKKTLEEQYINDKEYLQIALEKIDEQNEREINVEDILNGNAFYENKEEDIEESAIKEPVKKKPVVKKPIKKI